MNAKKILSLALVAGLLTTSAGTGFAQALTVAPQAVPATTAATAPNAAPVGMTLEAAVNAAIKNNLDLTLSDLDKAKRKNDLQKALDNLNYDVRSADDKVLYAAKDAITNLKNSQDASDESIAYNKAVIRNSVTNLFISIKKAEVQLAAQDAQILLDDAKLESDRVKARIGIISQYTLELNYSQYLKNRQTRETMAIGLEKTRLALKDLLGVDSQKPLTLDYNFMAQYPFEAPNYDSGLKKMETDSLSISMAKQSLKRSQERLSTLNERYPENKQTLSDITALKNAQDDLNKLNLDLNNKTTSAGYVYSTAHASVLDAMANYRQKQKDYGVAKTNYKNGTLKYKLNSISKVDYRAFDTQLKAADADQQAAWMDYVAARVNLDAVIAGIKTQ